MILAHQGGWDEALFVVGPLLFIVFLLRLAKRRAERMNHQMNDDVNGERNAPPQ